MVLRALADRAWENSESSLGGVARSSTALTQNAAVLLADGCPEVVSTLIQINAAARAAVATLVARYTNCPWRIGGHDAIVAQFGAHEGFELYELTPGEFMFTDFPAALTKREFRRLLSLRCTPCGVLDVPSGVLLFTVVGDDLAGIAAAVVELGRPDRVPVPSAHGAWIGAAGAGGVAVRTRQGRYELLMVDDPRSRDVTLYRLRFMP